MRDPVAERQGIVIRPPSEAGSFLLQVTYGCSHNKCTFCATYKFAPFGVRPFKEVREEIEQAARWGPRARRAFLCDGDALCLSTPELERILDCLNDNFPQLERVGAYANASNVLEKSPDELRSLAAKKLRICYLGLESGNEEILRRIRKGATAGQMVEAVSRAQECGIDISVIVLLGLGGPSLSREHARDSGLVASRMGPRYLSALTLMLLPGTPLYRDFEKGEFRLLGAAEILRELRWFIEAIDLSSECVFRTNHASNYLPIGGVLPRDKEKMLNVIDRGLADPSMLRPEEFRAL